jgi:dTDP-4-amino-4,6-dideoxygalactose transaminase
LILALTNGRVEMNAGSVTHRMGTRSDLIIDRDMIPFNRLFLAGNEFDYIRQALDAMQVDRSGTFTSRCQRVLQESLGVSQVLLTTSCTHALELAALLLDLKPGDEIVVPAFTFVSTINAFVVHGARPVFVDVRPDTLNIDESLLAKAVGPRTRAVVPVHYAGVACAMDEILDVCRAKRVTVIEDNAHGLFGRYKDRWLGTFGSLAALSFHETKNFTCGEGGALIINDKSYAERAETLREKGTNRLRFFRGDVDKYTWIDVGSSYAPSDILAAFLTAQLEARGLVQAKRQRAWDFYWRELSPWADARGVRLPVVPPYCQQSYHMFHLVLPSLDARQRTIAQLKERKITTAFHYQPLHISAMGRQFGGRIGDCPVTEDVADRLLRLPFFTDITEEQQRRVVQALKDCW